MPTVTSKDGTRIAYETSGTGEPLILVDGALCFRESGPMRPLAEKLKDRFMVVTYDRRGRGESGNTLPYAPDREVEDLTALIEAVGGTVSLYGCSSGGALALETADRVPGVKKVIVYEAPFIVDDTRSPLTDADRGQMDAFVAADRRGDAVKLFMRFVGVPGFGIIMMQFMRKVWKRLTGIAHTLPYDFAIVGPYQQGKPLPKDKWQNVKAAVLVADGGKSPAWMRNAQRQLASTVRAQYRTLDGETHMVRADAQAPMVTAFLAG